MTATPISDLLFESEIQFDRRLVLMLPDSVCSSGACSAAAATPSVFAAPWPAIVAFVEIESTPSNDASCRTSSHDTSAETALIEENSSWTVLPCARNDATRPLR